MAPLVFHVSVNGSDKYSGRTPEFLSGGNDGPWASLSGARDGLRRLRSQPDFEGQPVTVVIHGGSYELPETLLFGPEDSGQSGAPVRYIAAEGVAPVISGGRKITDWSETTHNGKRCWIAELPEVANGEWNFNRLYVNQSARPRPQVPRNGFYHFTGLDGLPDSGFNFHHGPDRANYVPGEIKNWHNLQDVELVSHQLWFETQHRIRALDEENNLVHFHAPSIGSLRDERGEFARYFVRNVFEALEEPGEWYLDRKAGILYYLPFGHESLASTVIIAPRLTEILRLQGNGTQRVSHLLFENLTLSHQQWAMPCDCTGFIQAAFGVPGAVTLKGAEACVFYGCQITHVSGYGIEILAGSTGNTLAACTICDTGAGGVKIGHEELTPHQSGLGDAFQSELPLPPIATAVVDCTIRDCGHLFPSAVGIWVGNSGWNRLLHNSISYCSYTGISCGWTWGYAPTRTVANRIENNHIHHINHREVLSDNGGIYTLGQQPGAVLRGNVIHDISCYGYGGWGIYPDEGSSEMLIEHNLVCGTKKAALFIHYGRDILIQQNLFALSQSDHVCLGKRELHRSAVLRRNLFLPRNGTLSGNWQPAHFTVEDNLFHTVAASELLFGGLTLADLNGSGQAQGTLVADPLCADAEGLDFSMRSDSPAFALGFKPWKWKTAGTRMQSHRPADYVSYKKAYPLPPQDTPVVRTRIELVTTPAEAFDSGFAEFDVIATNIGRGAACGSIRLAAGPRRLVNQPGLKRIDLNLAPGEEKREQFTLKIPRSAETIWLETQPVGDITIPARKLLFAPSVFAWAIPGLPDPKDLDRIALALCNVPGRTIRCGEQKVAEVKIAYSDAGLILHANYFQSILKPNSEHPWTGTAIELIVYQLPSDKSMPWKWPDRRQVCLVPLEGGIVVRRLNALATGTDPAPLVKATSTPFEGGREIAALIPWTELGIEKIPDALPFDLVFDIFDPQTGQLKQISTFDPVYDGWRCLFGQLICHKKGNS